MRNISKLLLPTILGITAYLIVNKFFPEKIKNFDKDPLLSLRGSRDIAKILPRILEKILTDRAIKIGLITLFGTAAVHHFQAEIEAILVDDVFNHICIRDTTGKLKIVCNIIEEHELHLHTKSMREVIVSNNLSDEQKISLLKIKLDFIVNGECGGKARFLVMILIASILTFTISWIGGLVLILEALYRLFQEGKISKAIYNI